MQLRAGVIEDINAIAELILKHEPNQWNYVPEDEIRQHVNKITTGETFAVVAEQDSLIIGAVTYKIGLYYPQYQPEDRQNCLHGYLAEAVVYRDYVGKGIGTMLLQAAIESLWKKGVQEVYAMRHADNLPSRRMMQKCNMAVIDEFPDPARRQFGSQRTAVTRIVLPDASS